MKKLAEVQKVNKKKNPLSMNHQPTWTLLCVKLHSLRKCLHLHYMMSSKDSESLEKCLWWLKVSIESR